MDAEAIETLFLPAITIAELRFGIAATKKNGVPMVAPQSELTWKLIRLVTPLFLLRCSVST